MIPYDTKQIIAEIQELILLEDCQTYGELVNVCSVKGLLYEEIVSDKNYIEFFDTLCRNYQKNPLRSLKRARDTIFFDNEEKIKTINQRIQRYKRNNKEFDPCPYCEFRNTECCAKCRMQKINREVIT